MQCAPHPINERERLAALHSYQILDTAYEAGFDAITQLAANVCGVPIAFVSLVDDERQWFKSTCGMQIESTPRRVSFCAHAILQAGIFEVPDAARDPRFHDNPLVTGEPFIRFYAGVPLIDAAGCALGTLCVLDRKPGKLSAAQIETLERLAVAVTGLITTRSRRCDSREGKPVSAAVPSPRCLREVPLPAPSLPSAQTLR